MNKIILVLLVAALSFIGFSGEFNSEITQADSPEVEFVALGDSITHGTGDHTEKGYIGWFKDKYKEGTNQPLLMKNFGVPKFRTTNLLEQLDQEDVKSYIQKADYLILYIGTNDFRKSVNFNFENINFELANEGIEQYSKNLNKIVSEIRNSRKELPIFILGLYHPYTNYKNQQQLGLLIYEWNITIQQVIRSYQHIHYVPTVDLFHSLPKESVFSDELHPNKKGHKLLANRLLETVLSVEEKPNINLKKETNKLRIE